MIEQRTKKNKALQKQEINKQTKNKSIKTSNNTSGGFYYSFMTIILILCLIQITISAVLNISKIISYHAKIIKITQTKNAAMTLNEQLKDNIRNFSNVNGLEAIARNNLKMSGEDEVLVIINTPKEETNTENKQNLLDVFKRHD